MKFFKMLLIVLILLIIGCSENDHSTLKAQSSDGINNWKVSVNESDNYVEFYGVVDFGIDSSIAIYSQAIDISFYNTVNPVYAYYNAGASDTRVFVLFEGSSDPGLYDSTFFAETDSANFVELLTDDDLSEIINYQKACINDTINSNFGCFNKAFGLKYIRVKFQGTDQNSTAATVRWSFILPKNLNTKKSKAFDIKDTRQ
jgi:hypothetical protein